MRRVWPPVTPKCGMFTMSQSPQRAGSPAWPATALNVLNSTFALVTQLAAAHSPTEVKLAASFSSFEAEYWRWLRWLPHVSGMMNILSVISPRKAVGQCIYSNILTTPPRHAPSHCRRSHPSQNHRFDFELVVILGELEMVETHPTVERLN